MSELDTIIAEIEQVLPKATPGPWSQYAKDPLVIVNKKGSSLGEMSAGDPYITESQQQANAALVALCSPDNIAALVAEVKQLREDAGYYRWRLQAIVPLFEEARDALPAISVASAKLHNVSLTLGDRMDKAGTATRDDYARQAEQGEPT